MGKSNYTYLDLINILNGMYDDKKVRNGDSIDWCRLESEATNSVIDELYQLHNNTSRSGFLNTVFNRLFNDGKDYNLGLVSKGISAFDNETDFNYVNNCKLTLNGLIMEVSENCSIYKNLDFTNIVMRNINSYTDSTLDFHFHKNNEVISSVQVEFALSNNKERETDKNWHPEIFKKEDYFRIFINFIKESDDKKYIREYSFIYRVMSFEQDGFIYDHIKPGNYKTWFENNFSDLESPTEIKTYDVCKTNERLNRYQRIKKDVLNPNSTN